MTTKMTQTSDTHATQHQNGPAHKFSENEIRAVPLKDIYADYVNRLVSIALQVAGILPGSPPSTDETASGHVSDTIPASPSTDCPSCGGEHKPGTQVCPVNNSLIAGRRRLQVIRCLQVIR